MKISLFFCQGLKS
uniref:Uncharacterized protein n=1 Tax=Arundo donax TaxID=35708 RepID=A0A0A9A1M6_ARUDO